MYETGQTNEMGSQEVPPRPRETPRVPRPVPSQPAASPPPKSSGGKRFGCLIAVLVVLFLGVAVVGLIVVGALSGLTDAVSSGGMLPETPPRRISEDIISGHGLDTNRKVAVINVKGIIMSGDSFDMAGSRRICYELKAARRDPNVVAVILDMDTPGGEVTASDEIHKEVRLCTKAGIPVVSCMHSVAASGGYYVASGSDWVVANRLTITGSIGVIISTTNYEELFNKVGLRAEVYKSGQMKDMLRGSRERTDMERAYVQGLVDSTFREFAAVVANGRMRYDTPEDVMQSEFGDGRILTGAEAHRLGLVDQLGYFEDAVEKAKELADVPVAKVVRYRRPMRLSDFLFSLQTKKAAGLRSLLHAEAQAIKPGRLYFLMPNVAP